MTTQRAGVTRWDGGVRRRTDPAAAERMPHVWEGTDRGTGLYPQLAALPGGATVVVYIPGGTIRFAAVVEPRISIIRR